MLKAAQTIRAVLFCIATLGLTGQAFANDHGGGGGGSDLITLASITTNLAPEAKGETHFIQLVVNLRLSDAKGAEAINAYMPQIINDILLVLASRTATALKSADAREDLADEIRDAVNAVVGSPGKTDKKGKQTPPEGPVKHALFTTLIVQ